MKISKLKMVGLVTEVVEWILALVIIYILMRILES